MTRASPRVLPRALPRAAARVPRCAHRLGAAALALALSGAPAAAQQAPAQQARPAARPGQDRAAQDRAGPDKVAPDRQERGAAPPVIACPSLANYRLLLRGGAAAAAAQLADPKADHLGCAALPRGRIAGVVDRVSLDGRDYDCAGVQGTTACHWTAAGTLPDASAAPPIPPPASRGPGGR